MVRYLIGLTLVASACVLLHIEQPVWAILPAVAGVYVLGSVLWDQLR